MNTNEYLSNPLIPKNFYNVKCTNVEVIEGIGLPTIIVKLQVVPYEKYGEASNATLHVTLRGSANAVQMHERFRETFRVEEDIRPRLVILAWGGLVHGVFREHGCFNRGSTMAKIKLDLHDIFNKGGQIEAELRRAVEDAVEKKVSLIEIIPGKGSGQLKKHVLRFLQQPEIKRLYHRVEKDSTNFGRIFVHFRH